MSKDKITITEVAKKLNVSISTISRALNDHHSISEKTKIKVRLAAAELNYSPNNVAASLRSGKVKSIGVMLPKINSNFLSNCVYGMENITYPAGYNLIICQSDEGYEKEVQSVKALIDSQVSGIILSLSNSTFNTNHIKNIIDRNIPLVMFDRIAEDLSVDSVVNDDLKVTIEAIQHFKDKKYKKIAILCGPTHIYVYKNRMQGYLEGLAKFNLKVNENWIFKDIETTQDAIVATEVLFNQKNKPDAVFCTSDRIALGVIKTLQKMNIKIPKEVGVIGYSNDTFADIIQPTLTTIEQYPKDIGANAAELMLDMIENKISSKKVHKNIHIQPKLIIRESTNR